MQGSGIVTQRAACIRGWCPSIVPRHLTPIVVAVLLLVLQSQVPAHVYDRSLFVFGTAFLLDVLGLFFELKTSRMDVVLLPAFVKGAATLTNALVRSGWATVAYSTGGRV